MSAVVKEVYDAFRSAGVTDELATAAAQSIPVSTDLATRADVRDLRAEISAVRAELGAEIGSVRAEMKHLELRMTIKLYSALGVAVAGVKALDFLIG